MSDKTQVPEVPNVLLAIARMKCPACRRGDIFKNTNPYHLSQMGDLYEKCPVCGENFRHEPGFYFGAAYVSYGLMVGFLIGIGLLYYMVFREIGDHMIRLLGIGVIAAVVVAPVIFRYSRIIYLYIIVRYKGTRMQSGK